MKKGSFLKRSAVVAFSVLLMAGCGGSGVTDTTSGGGTDGGTDGGTVTPPTTQPFATTCVGTGSSATLGFVNFDGASSLELAQKGSQSDNRPQSSTVVFSACSEDGTPVAGLTVSFSLSTSSGGIAISQASATTDANGQASTTITSGTTATAFILAASVQQSSITETKNQVFTIGGSVPDANSFSLSQAATNVDGYEFDGATAGINIRLADHVNNPVQDGTPVSFITNGGAIQSSCPTALAGGTASCSVTWESQDPQPCYYEQVTLSAAQTGLTGIDINEAVAVCGRAAVLAWTEGEESFNDPNQNGVYDAGETVIGVNNQPGGDLAEPYLDVNFNGQYDIAEAFVDANGNSAFDPSETYTDSNNNGVYDSAEPIVDRDGDGTRTAGDAKYTGLRCEETNASCTRGTLFLYDQRTVVMSGRTINARILPASARPIIQAAVARSSYAQTIAILDKLVAEATPYTYGDELTLLVQDQNGNPLAAGTTIAIAAEDVDMIPAAPSATLGQTATLENGQSWLNFTLVQPDGGSGTPPEEGTLTVTITVSRADSGVSTLAITYVVED
ncbi:Ig-like domain-containing protein [Pelagibaculum spongiae]|uniref:Uncharacterized protein n=1 Tax=Pelagibaculum spongiae TaxID=2080658 RepID=A0A2V1GZI1_9GAMM|nr:Ig-like domain-containing protein [Pelagibaculum spongiae]PVZ71583.1 hypothetical protein DC094_00640 [Pelagibaculum spongiae]